ncbi:hypothetical protein ACGFWI_13750 [Streptomyces sp. NPDC048434]|uniref:hypothetical protein n=1 Tax=Streptomyces sp. NPDC048434 TaxID=3365549 RepID=UPI003716029D
MADASQSSNERLHVDTDRLKPAIDKLQDLASQLKAAGRQLDDTCQAYGPAWGEDSTGEKFYGQYEGPHSQLITSAYQGSSGFRDSADQVGDMVAVFEGVEQQAGDQGRHLKASIDPQGQQNPPSGPTA